MPGGEARQALVEIVHDRAVVGENGRRKRHVHGLAGLAVAQAHVATHVAAAGRVQVVVADQLHQQQAVPGLAQRPQHGVQPGRVVEVGNHDQQPAAQAQPLHAFDRLDQFRGALLLEFRQALGDPHQAAVSGPVLELHFQVVREGKQSHAVMLGQTDGRQGQRHLQRHADLGRGLEVHAARAVHQQVNGKFLPLLEHLDDHAAEAPVDVPVDGAGIVARHVGLVVGELQAGALVLRELLGMTAAADDAPRPKAEALQRGQNSVSKNSSTVGADMPMVRSPQPREARACPSRRLAFDEGTMPPVPGP